MKIAEELSDFVQINFSKLAKDKVAKGEKLISLGLGEPYFPTPSEIVDETIKALKDGYTGYTSSLGLMELRKLAAEKLRIDNGIDANANNVVITVGAKQALLVALQSILRPKDEVINFTPCFLSFVPQIKIAEPEAVVHNVDLKCEDFTYDLERIRRTINQKTRAIIVNTPHNPTGTMLTRSQSDELVKILVEYPNCYLLSDEIYEYLAWSGNKHISFGSYPEIKDRVFTINGMSKSFSMTGWRLGYMSVPPDCMSIVASILQHSNMNVTTFIQKGACRAFDLDRAFIEDYCDTLKTSAEYIYSELRDTPLRMIMPHGSFFCFVDISETGMTSDKFATELLRATNVAVNPGILSGKNWDSHIRISFAGKFEEIKRGIQGIRDFLAQ